MVGLPALVNVTGSEGANDSLVVNALGGDDSVDGVHAARRRSCKLTVDGGAGNDTILGSHGADMLLGGDGNDFIDGNQGNDMAFLGAGDDVFQWDPGDGSDTVEGQDGTDTMLFNGANISENIDISANGGRVRFTRDVGNITMDLNDVEAHRLQRPGRRRQHHRQRPDRHRPRRRSTSTSRGSGGRRRRRGRHRHRQRHQRRRLDRGHRRRRRASPSPGLPAAVNITGSEAANDSLTVNALGGDDIVDASGAAGRRASS